MSLIFKALNPGATRAIWPEPSGWRLDRYADKPAALSLDIAGAHGMAERAIVEAYLADEDGADSFGDIIFRGFVAPYDDVGDEVSKISVPSLEKLLEHRYTQPVRCPPGTTLTKILTHDWPASSSEKPGLLCQANNLVQPGSFVLHSGNVWRLPQGGTAYLGNLHTLGDHVYINSVKQTWGSSAVLSAGQYWQDGTYTYIYSTKNPYYSIVLIEGCYETNIRLGTISLGSSTFAQSWRVGTVAIYGEIKRLLQAKGLEFQYSHNADGYTYLNASVAIGRGANAAKLPTYSYLKYKITQQKRNTSGGKMPTHAIRGLGIGRDATRQYHAEAAFPLGLRFVTVEEFPNQFAEQLQGTVAKLYDDRQDNSAWVVEAEDDPSAMPGDYCKIILQYDAPRIERIKQISESSDAPMKLYLGQRPVDVEDIMKAKTDVREALQRDLEQQFAEVSISGQENVDNAYPCNIKLTIPETHWDSEVAGAKWLLDITMNAFESSINQSQTPSSNHGSGGTSTKAGSGGTHDDHALDDVDTTDAASGWHAYIHTETGGQLGSGGEHYHYVNSGYEYLVSLDDHVHSFAASTYPGAADPHGGDADVNAHSVPVNPLLENVLYQLKKMRDGFGSLAYLTVTVQIINATYPAGVAVPGSPFYDIAIDESISDIDVTDLIKTGTNTIRISIAKYGGTGAVAARASVSLSGKLVLDTNY